MVKGYVAPTMMVVIILAGIGTIQASHVGPEWDTSGPYSRPLHAGEYDILNVEKEFVASHDGKKIAIAVWRPDVPPGEQVPVILEASPYYGNDLARPLAWQDHLRDAFVPHGFAFVRMAVRGTSESEGCMEHMGPNEQMDIDVILSHLGTRSWSNGKVAMIGLSYAGSTPWMGAAFGNPHLATIIPVSGVIDLASLFVRNGTAEDRTADQHVSNYWLGIGVGGPDRVHKWPDQACGEAPHGALSGQHAETTGETSGDYWQARDLRQRVLDNYTGSVYLVHGLQDWNVRPDQAFPFIRELEQKGSDVNMMLGQWGHYFPDEQRSWDPPSLVRWDWTELLLKWLNEELKSHDKQDGPAVWVQDNGRAWRTEQTWPPNDVDWLDLHIGQGQLSLGPVPRGTAKLGVYHPIQPSFVPTPYYETPLTTPQWVFRSEPVTETMRLAGLAQLRATFTTFVPEGIIEAEVQSVAPDGRVVRLAWGLMNIRYHDGTDEPVVLTPGDTFQAKFEFFPADAVVPVGSHVQLIITPNAKNGWWEPTAPGPLELHWGDGQSILRLPTLTRDVGDGRYPGQP